jgi:F-type H+-transporting ATPase subunit delta
MKISKQARRDAKTLFRNTFVNGVMDEARVRNTVTQLLAQKPRGYVGILGHLQRLVKLEQDRRSARVESALGFGSAGAGGGEGEFEQALWPGLEH